MLIKTTINKQYIKYDIKYKIDKYQDLRLCECASEWMNKYMKFRSISIDKYDNLHPSEKWNEMRDETKWYALTLCLRN